MKAYSLLQVCSIGEEMRHAQKMYFILIAKAKKTKLPEDFAEASKMLKTSKNLEMAFDSTLAEIRSESEVEG